MRMGRWHYSPFMASESRTVGGPGLLRSSGLFRSEDRNLETELFCMPSCTPPKSTQNLVKNTIAGGHMLGISGSILQSREQGHFGGALWEKHREVRTDEGRNAPTPAKSISPSLNKNLPESIMAEAPTKYSYRQPINQSLSWLEPRVPFDFRLQ